MGKREIRADRSMPPEGQTPTDTQSYVDAYIGRLRESGAFDNPVRPTSIIGNGPPLIVCYRLRRGAWLSALTSPRARSGPRRRPARRSRRTAAAR